MSEALKALQARRKKAKKEGRIDDSSLYAGSPMHFYCKLCGLIADVLPEEYDRRYTQPKKHCAACEQALASGQLKHSD